MDGSLPSAKPASRARNRCRRSDRPRCEAARNDALPANAIRFGVRFRDGRPGRADAPSQFRTRHRAARPDARAAPGSKGSGYPTPLCASLARVPGAATLNRASDVRSRNVHRARRPGRHGPARACGRLRLGRPRRARGARPPGRRTRPRPRGETVVRLLVERNGRQIPRALDERCPERTIDAGNETYRRGVVSRLSLQIGSRTDMT